MKKIVDYRKVLSSPFTDADDAMIIETTLAESIQIGIELIGAQGGDAACVVKLFSQLYFNNSGIADKLSADGDYILPAGGTAAEQPTLFSDVGPHTANLSFSILGSTIAAGIPTAVDRRKISIVLAAGVAPNGGNIIVTARVVVSDQVAKMV